MAPALAALIDGAKQDITVISPYFVPSQAEDKQFRDLLGRGVTFRLVTNSLASTDEPAVHVGYSEHRRSLLEAGAEIFELKPFPGQKQSLTEIGKDSAVGLHAKAFTVDSRYVFVGSMNMDNRSKLVNTEMGFVVDSPALAQAIDDYFNILRQPANAYRVTLSGKDEDGDGKGDGSFLRWRTEDDGNEVLIKHEPEASAARRAEVMLLHLLPIDGLL
jgi:putative cardiolipin synthase